MELLDCCQMDVIKLAKEFYSQSAMFIQVTLVVEWTLIDAELCGTGSGRALKQNTIAAFNCDSVDKPLEIVKRHGTL